MKIEFDQKSHTYTLDGVSVPSVTTVIKATVPTPFSAAAWWGWKLGVQAAFHCGEPALDVETLEAAAKLTDYRPDKTRDDAAARGNLIHAAMEHYAGDPVPINEKDFLAEYRPQLKALNKWLSANDPEIHKAEQMVGHSLHMYAGTLDAFVTFHSGVHQGLTARLDWKTSKNVYPEQHFPQIEAYEEAAVYMGQFPADIRGVVHLPATGKPVKMHVSNFDFEDFYVLLKQHQQQESRRNG